MDPIIINIKNCDKTMDAIIINVILKHAISWSKGETLGTTITVKI